jgi:hypothetical protein
MKLANASMSETTAGFTAPVDVVVKFSVSFGEEK